MIQLFKKLSMSVRGHKNNFLKVMSCSSWQDFFPSSVQNGKAYCLRNRIEMIRFRIISVLGRIREECLFIADNDNLHTYSLLIKSEYSLNNHAPN